MPNQLCQPQFEMDYWHFMSEHVIFLTSLYMKQPGLRTVRSGDCRLNIFWYGAGDAADTGPDSARRHGPVHGSAVHRMSYIPNSHHGPGREHHFPAVTFIPVRPRHHFLLPRYRALTRMCCRSTPRNLLRRSTG
jgi:hypothetical protein